MLAHVIDVLACPHCAAVLSVVDATLRCESGHSFDIARQGYVSLLPQGAHTDTGDTPAMVEARDAFLGAGYYAPIAEAVADALGSAIGADASGCVADIGAGTGYYLAEVLDRMPGLTGLALDTSKPALRRAARAHERIGAVACDAWAGLPIRDGGLGAALDIFAPRNAAEIHRTLAPGGALVVVTPSPGHLRELVEALGLLTVDERKDERLTASLGGHFDRTAQVPVRYSLALDRGALAALVGMGPSAYHLEAATVAARIAALPDPFETHVDVIVSVWKAR
ncbi:MAG: putative RNA methyltransferase [Coriobacteriia bacterium]